MHERVDNATGTLAPLLSRGAGVAIRETALFYGGSGAANRRWRDLQRLVEPDRRRTPAAARGGAAAPAVGTV
eukprot:2243899-Prymnesium_polylepis.1